MLQFPTNIYPQNVAFDPSVADDKNRLRFIFNGDILTTASFKIYNYQTGEFVRGSFYASADAKAWHYNGEEVSFASGTLGSGLSAGNDYTIQMMLTQSKADGSANIYDMCVVRGSIQETPTTATSLKLKDGIMNIYEWNVLNGLCQPTSLGGYVAAGMIIKIGTETRFINSYNRTTGELIIESAFTTTPQIGDTYEIYSNYLVTPQYYFKCETYPTLSVTSEIMHIGTAYAGDIHVTGSYSQSQNCMIKSYTMKLYWDIISAQPESTAWKLIKELPPVYSQNIVGDFYDCLIGVDTVRNDDVLRITYYKVVCDIITQDGMSMSANYIFSVDVNDSEDYLDIKNFTATIMDADKPDYIPSNGRNVHHGVRLTLGYNTPTTTQTGNYYVDLYRKDLENKKIVKLKDKMTGGTGGQNYVDYTVPNKGKFKYYCVPRDLETSEPYSELIKIAEVETKMLGWSITYLEPTSGDYSRSYYNNRYLVKECWKFVGEIQDTTITQNMDRVVHVGHNRYTAISTGVPNYASGTLSAMLGYVDCVDRKFADTIDMVNAWREFITQDGIFMLKSPKGDVFIVVITDAPTTTYQEDNIAFPTTFSFSWAECASLDDIFIQPW